MDVSDPKIRSGKQPNKSEKRAALIRKQPTGRTRSLPGIPGRRCAGSAAVPARASVSFPLHGGGAKRRGGKKRARPARHGSRGVPKKTRPRRARATSGAVPVHAPLTRQCPRSQAHQAQARARTTTAVNRAGRAHANKREALPTAGRQGPAEDGGEAGAPLARQAATPLPPTIHTVAQSKSNQARPAGDSNVDIGKGSCASANEQTEGRGRGQLMNGACPPTANDTPAEPYQGGAVVTGGRGSSG